MRRLGTLMGTMVLLVALVAGTALADQLITLTNGADIYTGDAKRQHVEALAGNDLVFGAGGDDDLFGQGGRDKLFGISGNDLILGGPGEISSTALVATTSSWPVTTRWLMRLCAAVGTTSPS